MRVGFETGIALAEVKPRDILEHNAGVVNAIYLRKAGKKARYASGDRFEIDDTYHLESWRLIKKVVADLKPVRLETKTASWLIAHGALALPVTKTR